MKLKDPVSSITHYIGLGLTILFGIPLIIKGFGAGTKNGITLIIFIVGMALLYMASGTYHAISSTQTINRVLKKLDHCMIFVLIASSYTPICIVSIGTRKSFFLLVLIWFIALSGICLKLFIVYHPKWISSVLYISMGWLCIFLVIDIYKALNLIGFIFLVLGGILYTIGGVIYALKLKVFNSKHKYWGSHEIFHIFVMCGSLCHYIVMWTNIAV